MTEIGDEIAKSVESNVLGEQMDKFLEYLVNLLKTHLKELNALVK